MAFAQHCASAVGPPIQGPMHSRTWRRAITFCRFAGTTRLDSLKGRQCECRQSRAAGRGGAPAARHLGRPVPPSRVHRQGDHGMLGASWVLGAWSGGAHVGSAGGLLVLAHLGRTGLQEHTERPGRGRGRKKFHRISDGSNGAERTLFGPSMPDGPRASRNSPAESAGPRLGAGQGLGRVPECLVHGLVMPSRGRMRVGWRA
jgi:hypothetical protein